MFAQFNYEKGFLSSSISAEALGQSVDDSLNP